MSFENKRVAFIVSHPAHLLTVVGMLLQWRPHILMLDEAPTGPGAGQTQRIQQGLAMVGLAGNATSLAIDEDESYRRAISGDHAFHLNIADRIEAWLREVKPDAVFGDAYETSNFQHDIGRLMMDEAIRRVRKDGVAIENYEFPLSSRGKASGAELSYGIFQEGESSSYELTEEQIAIKQQVVTWARGQDSFVDHVAEEFPSLTTERYREVPADRDYELPPLDCDLHYDIRGKEEVEAGKYTTAISFAKHFAPLAKAVKAQAS